MIWEWALLFFTSPFLAIAIYIFINMIKEMMY